MDKSRLPNFYKYSVSERLRLLYERQVLSEDSYHTLMDGVATLDVESADRMVENVVGVFGLPMGLGLNFVINDKPCYDATRRGSHDFSLCRIYTKPFS